MRRDSAKMISSLLYGHNTVSSLRSSGLKAKGKGKLPQRNFGRTPFASLHDQISSRCNVQGSVHTSSLTIRLATSSLAVSLLVMLILKRVPAARCIYK